MISEVWAELGRNKCSFFREFYWQEKFLSKFVDLPHKLSKHKEMNGLKTRKLESISFRTLLPILGPNPSYVILDKSWVTVAEVEVVTVQATKVAFKNPILMPNALGAIHILRNH